MAIPIDPEVSDKEKQALKAGLVRALDVNTFTPTPAPGFADLLAGPAPNNPFGAFQHRAGRAICDRWARGQRAQIVPFRDAYYRQLCTPYLGDGMPGDPSTAPEFTGGQCSETYNLSYGTFVATIQNCPQPEFSVTQTITGGDFATNILGPIRSISPVFDLDNACGPRRLRARVVTDAGELFFTITQTGSPDDFLASAPVGFSVARVDGPDNCGDPPPLFDSGDPNPTPDPNPGPVGGPTGFPFPDLDITIGPAGDIQIDFGDGSPPETIDPADPGEEGGPGGVPTTPGSPAAPSAPGAGGESSGEAPQGQELTGVLVEVVAAPGSANQFDNISATTFRGTGYVAMGYPGLLGIDTSGAVVQSPQFFHAQQRGLTAWRVRANVGFSLRATPYYREISE